MFPNIESKNRAYDKNNVLVTVNTVNPKIYCCALIPNKYIGIRNYLN